MKLSGESRPSVRLFLLLFPWPDNGNRGGGGGGLPVSQTNRPSAIDGFREEMEDEYDRDRSAAGNLRNGFFISFQIIHSHT